MHFQTLRRFLMILVCIFCPIWVFCQGLYWETTTTLKMGPGGGGNDLQTKSYYLPGMFKQGNADGATVFHLDTQMMYAIDYGKKEYSEMTFAQLAEYVKKTNARAEAQIAELKKQLAQMPPEQRKAMEGMMGAQLDDDKSDRKIEVTTSKVTKTISGYTCTNYVLTEGGKEVGNVWSTTSTPGFSTMKKDFMEFNRMLASQMTRIGPQMVEAMQTVDGFPIQTTIGGGITALVHNIAKMNIAKSEFDVPAGFKKVDSIEAMKGRRGKRGSMQPPTDQGGDHEQKEN